MSESKWPDLAGVLPSSEVVVMGPRPQQGCTGTRFRLRVSLLLALALGAVALPTAVAGSAGARVRAACANANRSVARLSLPAMRVAVLCLINQQRTGRGLPALHESSKLDRVAQHWAGWMEANRDFSHGPNWTARFGAVGYQGQTEGENIGTGPGTPAGLVRMWMRSRFHCRNILYPGFSQVGTGGVPGIIGRRGRRGGTWTQDYGLPIFAFPVSQNLGPMNGCPDH